MLHKPNPIDSEIHVLNNASIMVKTDRTGIIEYANLEYANLSEYEVDEIIGKDISVLAHPDMPGTVFNHIWERLFKKQRTYAILKNISKSGKYFWLQVNFDFKVNEKTREIESIYAYYSKASNTAKIELGPIYKKIKAIEEFSGMEVAENYLTGFLDEKGLKYDDLIGKYLTNTNN